MLSTSESTSLLVNSIMLATGFRNDNITNCNSASTLQETIVKDEDSAIWKKSLKNIMKKCIEE